MPVPSWALRLRPSPVPVCRVRAAAARGRADADDGPGPRARGRPLLAAWSRIQDPGSGVLPLLPPTWSQVRAWLHGGPGPVERSEGSLSAIDGPGCADHSPGPGFDPVSEGGAIK